jgi:SEC-C motif
MSSRASDASDVDVDVVRALSSPHPCACRCHETLTPAERAQGVAAMFRFDDAMRGWGYVPLYHPSAHGLYREAQARNDASYRGIAVRDEECIYRRLVGFAVHELIHALEGDPTRANHGIPFGLPYGVPDDVPVGGEKEYLHPYNLGEARAWVGVPQVARALFAIEWELRTARDVGTYGFAGGNAIVPVPAGFRAVPHVDRVHHPERYYALARRLEESQRDYFTDEKLTDYRARFAAAEARGRASRRAPFPAPESLARLTPRALGRNDPCGCGSGKKYKKCCGG